MVINLYPFENTVARPDCSLAEAIENIDIGGPTMVSCGKPQDVTIVVNVSDYEKVLADLTKHNGATSYALRFDLAIKAYEHTAAYDGAIANYFGQKVEGGSEGFPRTLNSQFIKVESLRYGENPHQASAFYVEKNPQEVSIATATQLQGKALSYNNIADTDAALETVKLFSEPSCVIVKHANPCGVATADTIQQAYLRAFATDPESAFGGIIAFNRALDENTAADICERQFVEVIIAPGASDAAQAVIAAKKELTSINLPALVPIVTRFRRKTGKWWTTDSRSRHCLSRRRRLDRCHKRQPTPEK